MNWKLLYIRILRLYDIIFLKPRASIAYPIFAQQAYNNPREPNGRIVCANCHLAQKTVELEVPQAVFSDTVFNVNVAIPYDTTTKQVLRNGKWGDLRVGAVLLIPEGFHLSPPDRITPEDRRARNGLYFQPYRKDQPNIIVVGPVPGKEHRKIAFPIEAPNVELDSATTYRKYSIYVGGNRGRGQIYPDGSKSNNTVYTSPVGGIIKEIIPLGEKKGFRVVIETSENNTVNFDVPKGPELRVKLGQKIQAEDPLTTNPNVGGFGQNEVELVIQDRYRVEGLLRFFRVVFVTQILLVLKKKQFEKVQLAEKTF
jgi:apocytochrome f